jgi:LysR family transcriptional regulator, hydrogen peroxide-inducible genes activator
MSKIQQLRYLVAIADTLSFSRAAETCHVTQPTLSMQLKDLEEQLNTQLVERTRSRVILTPVGAEIARRARSILADVEDIKEIARRDGSEATNSTLRIGVVQTVGAYLLSLVVPRLRQASPDLRITVREDRLENLPQNLSDGTYDFLLLPHEPEHPDFTSVRLMREPLHLVLPSDHRLARFETIDPEALCEETILTMELTHNLYEQIARLCGDVGAIHIQDYAGTTLDTLRQMVAIGMGLSLLPALYIRSEVLREKLVVARPLSHSAPTRDLTMVWRKSSPRQTMFEALAASFKSSLAPWE